MAPPIFVADYKIATPWTAVTTPKTTSITVSAGETLVVCGITRETATLLNTPTGGGLTYTLQRSVTAATQSGVWIWTAVSATTQTFTLSITSTSGGTAYQWGFSCLTFSGANGVGGGNSASSASVTAPSLSVTTLNTNSAIIVVNGDYNGANGDATRVWRANAGALTEKTYFRQSLAYAGYIGYHADSGPIGTYAVGLTVPNQKWSIAAIELKGLDASTAPPPDSNKRKRAALLVR